MRLVSQALLATDDWSKVDFRPYAEERLERMRRLRFTASLVTTLDSEFGPEAEARRRRVYARWSQNPASIPATLAVMIGPELLPPEAFTPEAREAALALS
ncbi:MAG: hypothetical protein WEB00_02310 [Dehalococcoidia bacterium]